MFRRDDLTLDCNTCLAANTTACNDCVVTHLLANDSGPIDLEPVPIALAPDPVDAALDLFRRAGLVGDRPDFVSRSEFEAVDPTLTA